MAIEEDHQGREENQNDTENVISELPERSYSLTVELPMFLVMASVSLAGTPISNILLYRTCVHSLGHSNYECQMFLAPNKENHSQELEEEVQQYAIFISTVKIVIESLMPGILSLFLGVWSDTYGRKPLITWPLIGISLSGILIVVYSILDQLGPWWYILTIVPYSLTGGYTVLFTGAFCYLSDISSVRNRSLRMTVLESAVSIGSIIGSVLCPYVLRAVGNVYLLLITACLQVVAYVFTDLCVTESLRGALSGGLSKVLDILLVKEMLRECFKRRPNNLRAQMLLLTLVNSFLIFILYGTISSQYYYTREKLHWEMQDYTTFSAASTLISFVGAFFGVLIVQRYLKVSDLAFAIIACISSTVEYVIRILSITTWHMYLGASVSVFKGLSTPLIRSMITKIMPIEDIAKVFALLCAFEAVCPLIAPPLFNSLYAITITNFPGAFYLLGAMISSACVVMLGFVQYYQNKSNLPSYQPMPENES